MIRHFVTKYFRSQTSVHVHIFIISLIYQQCSVLYFFFLFAIFMYCLLRFRWSVTGVADKMVNVWHIPVVVAHMALTFSSYRDGIFNYRQDSIKAVTNSVVFRPTTDDDCLVDCCPV